MNSAEIDNHNAAVQARKDRLAREAKAHTNCFRDIELPPPGERQSLKGFMRQYRERKRLEAEARQARSDAAFPPGTRRSRSHPRKARRDERIAQVDMNRLADHILETVEDTSPDGSYGGKKLLSEIFTGLPKWEHDLLSGSIDE